MKIPVNKELVQELTKSATKLNILVNISVKNKNIKNMRKYMNAFSNIMETIKLLEVQK